MRQQLPEEQKAFLQVSFWTLTIIAVLSLSNFLFIINSVGPGVKIPFARNIASISESEVSSHEQIPPKILFDCESNKFKKNWKTQASSVRILFNNCTQISALENESNKNQGHIFPLPSKQSTSDFIFLSPGKNKLSLMIHDKPYTIEITREKSPKEQTQKAL